MSIALVRTLLGHRGLYTENKLFNGEFASKMMTILLQGTVQGQ